MKIPESIITRKSVRDFLEEDISASDVETLIHAAILAPSAGNLQPWAFIIVRKSETKQQLAEAASGQTWMISAPVIIIICAIPLMTRPRYGERGVNLYCIQDTAAAAENILLTASYNGLGGTWVGAFDEEKVAAILRIPKEVRPIIIIPIGHPAYESNKRSRHPLAEVLREEVWN